MSLSRRLPRLGASGIQEVPSMNTVLQLEYLARYRQVGRAALAPLHVLTTRVHAVRRRTTGSARHDQLTPGLSSFADAAGRVGPLTQRLPRPATVDIAQVIGSVGRSHEL